MKASLSPYGMCSDPDCQLCKPLRKAEPAAPAPDALAERLADYADDQGLNPGRRKDFLAAARALREPREAEVAREVAMRLEWCASPEPCQGCLGRALDLVRAVYAARERARGTK